MASAPYFRASHHHRFELVIYFETVQQKLKVLWHVLQRVLQLVYLKLIWQRQSAPVFIFQQLFKSMHLLLLEVINRWLD